MVEKDLAGILIIIIYYGAVVGGNILLGFVPGYPPEIVRKSYHILGSLSIFLFLYVFETWYVSAATAAVIFFPGSYLSYVLRQIPWIKSKFFDRIPRESQIPQQLFYAGIVFSGLIAFFWGGLGPGWKYHVATGVVVWGVGDAAAALLGKKYGKRNLPQPPFDEGKSLEGFLAFVLTSWPALIVSWYFMTDISPGGLLAGAFILSLAGGVVEALTKKGLDTLTIPLTVSFLSALMALMGLHG